MMWSCRDTNMGELHCLYCNLLLMLFRIWIIEVSDNAQCHEQCCFCDPVTSCSCYNSYVPRCLRMVLDYTKCKIQAIALSFISD